MPRTDAVAWLEEYGYARDLDAGALTPDERSARYARMRQDRVARKGEPAFDQQLVTRDVIASQRIEGVDARLWLQPGV